MQNGAKEGNAKPAETIDIEADLNASDMRRARFYDLLLRRKWFGAYVVIFFLLSMAFIVSDATGFYNIPVAGLMIAILFLLFLVGGFLYLLAISNGGKKRALHFSPQAVRTPANTDNRTLTFPWEKFLDIRETKNYLYFYIDVTQFLIVPKRCFQRGELQTVKGWALASERPYHIKANRD